jgi:hypothetical protein
MSVAEIIVGALAYILDKYLMIIVLFILAFIFLWIFYPSYARQVVSALQTLVSIIIPIIHHS